MQTAVGLSILAVLAVVVFISWWNGRKPNPRFKTVAHSILNSSPHIR